MALRRHLLRSGGTRDEFRQEPVTGNPSDGRCISEFGSTHKHKAQRRFFISHRSITTKSLGVGTSLCALCLAWFDFLTSTLGPGRTRLQCYLITLTTEGVFIIVYGGTPQ